MLQDEIDMNNRDFSLEAIAVNLVGDCGSGSVPSFYSEESANQPYLTIEYTNATDFTAYTYDRVGNLLTDGTYYYEYNTQNQLFRIRIQNKTGQIVEQYYYDENGDRAIKIHFFNATSNETTYYFGKDYVRVVNASGVYDTIMFYLGDTLVAERMNDSTMLFYHPDHLGSTSLITNILGALVEETFYTPFGAIISGGNMSRFDYTGKETDYIGLEYFGARYYNPDIGRWIQPDTIIPDIYDPQNLNHYTFVRNNPYRYTDPNGHQNAPVESIMNIPLALTYFVKVNIVSLKYYLLCLQASSSGQTELAVEYGLQSSIESADAFFNSISYLNLGTSASSTPPKKITADFIGTTLKNTFSVDLGPVNQMISYKEARYQDALIKLEESTKTGTSGNKASNKGISTVVVTTKTQATVRVSLGLFKKMKQEGLV